MGRFGRRTLQNMDLAMPLDLVDPKSGMDYFKAVDILENEYYGQVRAKEATMHRASARRLLGKSVSGCCRKGSRTGPALRRVHSHAKHFNHFATNELNASYGIYSMDILCNPGCGKGKHNRYYPSQYQQCYRHCFHRNEQLQLRAVDHAASHAQWIAGGLSVTPG